MHNKIKKIVFSIFFICFSVPLFALDWGVLYEWVAGDYLINNWEKSGIYKLIKREPIKYYVSEYKENPEKQEFLRNKLPELLNAWPQETLKYIKKSGREQEFADIVEIITPKLSLVEGCHSECLIFNFKPTASYEHSAVGDYEQFVSTHFINIAGLRDNNFIINIVLHELGHFYGLADQYYEENEMGNEHFEYSSPRNRNSMMSFLGATGPSNEISCDDADGFINLIDLALYRMENKWSERANKGWKSLCENGTNLYKQSRTVNRPSTEQRGDFAFLYEDGKNVVAVDFREYNPFLYRNYTDIKRDEKGRIISQTDEQKVTTKFEYGNINEDSWMRTMSISYEIYIGDNPKVFKADEGFAKKINSDETISINMIRAKVPFIGKLDNILCLHAEYWFGAYTFTLCFNANKKISYEFLSYYGKVESYFVDYAALFIYDGSECVIKKELNESSAGLLFLKILDYLSRRDYNFKEEEKICEQDNTPYILREKGIRDEHKKSMFWFYDNFYTKFKDDLLPPTSAVDTNPKQDKINIKQNKTDPQKMKALERNIQKIGIGIKNF